MDPQEFNPRLRIAPVPIETGGKKMLLFQDPERITEQTVVIPLEAAAIIQFFDGARSIRQIQEELVRQTGEIIDSDLIRQIADELDKHLLLDSPRFHRHLRDLNEKWAALRVRPPGFAGDAYPADKEELARFLDAFYTSPQGPGEPPPPAPSSNDLKGIVAPHMSISDAGATAAHAFKRLAEATEAELFVIFGTGHMEGQRMFVMSDKDYHTPLGPADTDRELVHRVKRLMKDRNPLNDYPHKQEHSIEFMALYLVHALRNRKNMRIMPVLASGTATNTITGTSPAKEPAYKDFMDALRRALDERGEPVCFIAAADLAHLGPRYGDSEHYSPIKMKEEEEADRRMLEPLLAGDEEGFFRVIADERDRRKICGLPPMFAAMEASGAGRAEILKWDYWQDRQTQSVVTFTSMALY